jgi:HK97 family phage portal protein
MKYKGIFKVANNIRQVVRNIFSRASKSGTSTAGTPAAWLQQFLGGAETWSGTKVDENTALEYVAFWTCLKVIRETIASLPMILYKRTEDGKKRAINHPAYNVVHLRPNPEQTAFDYKEMITYHYLLYGNTYSEKVYDDAGNLVELWPLLPWNMKVIRHNGKKWYLYTILENGSSTEVVLFQDEILHISNSSLTGLMGDRPLDYVHEAVGSGLSAEEYSARFFKNDARPGGIIEMPGNMGMKKDVRKRFKESWAENYGKMENKHRTAILEDGAKFHEIGFDPEKSQLLEMKKYQSRLMATFNRLPPHLIGDLDNATYSNIEEQSLEFIRYSMLPHFTRFEQNFTVQLLNLKEQKKYFFELLIDNLVRADIEKRYNAYRIGREGGWLSPDDVRFLENLNKLPDGIGDVYHVPANWVELGAPAPAQQPAPPQEGEENNCLKLLTEKRWLDGMEVYRSIFTDIMGRIMKREIVDLKKGRKKYAKRAPFQEWAEKFYDEFRRYVFERISPIFPQSNQDLVETFMSDYVSRHREEIRLIELAAKGEDIFHSWEDSLQNVYDDFLSMKGV